MSSVMLCMRSRDSHKLIINLGSQISISDASDQNVPFKRQCIHRLEFNLIRTTNPKALLDGHRFSERDGSLIRDVGQRTPSSWGYPITTPTSTNNVGTSGTFKSSRRIHHIRIIGIDNSLIGGYYSLHYNNLAVHLGVGNLEQLWELNHNWK
ncbi:hypothetical protein Tco_1388998 [Tanacetum coccineum]